MGTRLELQSVLDGIIATALGEVPEVSQVYFQPPSNVTMKYPCIVYNRDYRYAAFADNSVYSRTTRYQITVIDPDPDSLIPDMVGSLPLSAYVRHLIVDNLNQDIYDVYY